MKAFTDLDVWKKSRVLRDIAEGHERYHFADSSNFYLTLGDLQ
ncbi:hypothetical protein ACFQZI_04450 [Mucilaginibacter lutimaris]|uniref:Four helix bundle protein n=1 Tax=Mucilaginibacter lutimaris TaxID=931629 RepID=A0ABW2ZD32_9SPHI